MHPAALTLKVEAADNYRRSHGEMKKNLILFLFIIIVFVYFQHRSTPNVPMPSQYKSVGQNIAVSAHLGLPAESGEVWTVAKKNDTTYIINVYNNSKLIHTFFTAKAIKHDNSGTTFGTGGNITFNGYPYTAQTIHIEANGQTGEIVFAPVSKQTKGN